MSTYDADLEKHITTRMEQGNLTNNMVGLAIDEAPEFDYLAPSANLFEVSGIYDGVADFEIIVAGPYEVNVADWCAEYYAKTNHETNDGASWEIAVTPFFKVEDSQEWTTAMSNGDMPEYLVTDETFEG